MSEFQTIIVEKQGAVTVVTLNRPEALNALNSQVLADLLVAFTAYDADSSQRCLVLTGSEKAFAAGADIKEMQPRGFSQMFGENYFAGTSQIAATRKPWIAAVAGFALGGGCELAMTADFIIAADTARFGQPEVKLGVIPGFGGTQRLVRRIGAMTAAELCFTGRNVKADEAVSLGLALRVVADQPVLDAALALAEQIGAMGPVAVRLCKQAVNAATDADLRGGLLLERDLFALCFSTADQKEGMAAFLQKRPAAFSGA